MVRIGLDLDNTLIRYDRAFHAAALERGLIPEGLDADKQAVCRHIRVHAGEPEWQRLQGYVYGAGLEQAELYPGVMDFLQRAKRQGDALMIVSHKTQFGHFDAARVNLRDAARHFLGARGVFDFVSRDDVHFFATREEKVRYIGELNCHVFVDDLEEVFTEPGWPEATRKIWFNAHGETLPDAQTCADWRAISECVYDAVS
jgi:hypothetical protein